MADLAHPHQRHLDGMRAILATFVVAHHSWLTVYPPESGGTPTCRAALWSGWLSTPHGVPAVDWFIVLSGYVLMLTVVANGGRLRGGAVGFYLRRARRILPTFYAAVAVSLLLGVTVVRRKTGTHWDICVPPTWRAVLSNGLMLQDVWQGGKINHAFWSVAIETRIYVLFPAVVWAFRRVGAVPSAAAFVVLGTVASFACAWAGHEEFQLTPSYVGLFVLGGLAASRVWRPWVALPLAVAATAVAAWQQWNSSVPPGAYTIPAALMRQPFQDLAVGSSAAAWMAYWATPRATAARAVLGWRPLAAVGAFAYSLYLVHAPLVQLSWQLFVRPHGLTGGPALAVLIATAVPVATGGAFLFYLAAERPFLSRRQRAAAADQLGSADPVGYGSVLDAAG